MLVHGKSNHWSMTARDTFYKSNSESWYTTPHYLDIRQHKYNQFLQKNLLIDIHYLPSLFVTVWSCCCSLLTVGRQCTPASTKWHPTANPSFTTRRRAHIHCRPWTSNSYFFYCISIPLHQETSLGRALNGTSNTAQTNLRIWQFADVWWSVYQDRRLHNGSLIWRSWCYRLRCW